MLGKLIKNDMKSSARGVAGIYFAAGIVAAAMIISLFTGFGTGKMVATFALLTISFVALIVTIVQMFNDFRKTMFGDRGYLTNTLPVKSYSLLFSKWITSIVWILIGSIFLAFCYFLVYVYYTGESGLSAVTMILDNLEALGLPSMGVLKVALPFYAVKIFCWLAVNVAIAYFSVTVSNIKPFQNFGIIGTILAFFIIFGVVNGLGGKLDDLVSMAIVIMPDALPKMTVDADVIANASLYGGAFVSLTQIYFEVVAAIVIFVVNSELIEKKINVR